MGFNYNNKDFTVSYLCDFKRCPSMQYILYPLDCVVTGLLCVMSLLFCQHGCPLCHVATAEAAVWIAFWGWECHHSAKGEHPNTQHKGFMRLTMLQDAERRIRSKHLGYEDVLTKPNVGIQLTAVRLWYSTQNHCHCTILCSQCTNTLKFITATTRDQQQNTTWTTSILSPISSSSILILYFKLHLGPHKWPQCRLLTKRFYCTKHVWHLMTSTFTGHVSQNCHVYVRSPAGLASYFCNMNASK